ncbi:DUF302 domain-containing protein [Roseibium denhamense]|uniref:DUF302 domain-containing protein n=1 Tax=Roseibium denhamense TaxID=76305 RepID=A0ABY1P0C5_9HYPH|nr:DUF302 domain-containing protein [Roseibium denhamense]MTI04893.1 DUF302 domain-containing protein [Roseibium denhamense]SMP20611.1 hypothetical protein SAMN06265374_2124 [Roseibium denhamense]
MKSILIAAAFGLALGGSALAEKPFTYPFDGSFEDATFAVESAIVGQGLVIDFVSHVGEMLNRTGADVGSDTMIFKNADIFLFCSAVISRQVMEKDPMNITHCPYGIFVMDTDEGVLIGHKDYPDGSMQAVENLMQQIVAEAVGN